METETLSKSLGVYDAERVRRVVQLQLRLLRGEPRWLRADLRERLATAYADGTAYTSVPFSREAGLAIAAGIRSGIVPTI